MNNEDQSQDGYWEITGNIRVYHHNTYTENRKDQQA